MEPEILALEHSFLKVPHEQVVKSSKSTQQLVDSEIDLVSAKLEAIVAEASTTPPRVLAKDIDGLLQQLLNLKQQVNGLAEVEKHLLETAALRIEHLNVGLKAAEGTREATLWKQQRLDRLVCDHLLRAGHYQTAESLAKLAGIESFTNLAIFKTSKEIEDALTKRDCGPALEWCDANRARLTKLKSTLEFKLHLQNYIRHLKSGDRAAAIAYARDHFGQHTDRHLRDIQIAMGLLVYRQPTTPEQAEMLAEDRWDGLVQQFRRNIFALHSLAGQSVLDVTLQAGLSVLKNYGCLQDDERNADCPVCADHMNALAQNLPYANHTNSRLVCSISGEIMNEDNPPMALPNGNVYGRNALEAMAAEHDGTIMCPRMHRPYPFAKARKVYIM